MTFAIASTKAPARAARRAGAGTRALVAAAMSTIVRAVAAPPSPGPGRPD